MKSLLCFVVVFFLTFPFKAACVPVLIDFKYDIRFSVNGKLFQSLTNLQFQSVFIRKKEKEILKRFYHITCEEIHCRVLSFDITNKKIGYNDLKIVSYLIKSGTFFNDVGLIRLEGLELKIENQNFIVTELIKNTKIEWLPESNPLLKK